MTAATADTAGKAPERTGAAEIRCAVFSVSGTLLALPAAAVRRFLPLPRLDRPPTAPPVVEGLFRYRGQAVPVLRLDRLFGLPLTEPGLYAPLLLVEREERPLALLAERVLNVVSLDGGALLPADPGLTFNGCAAGSFAFAGGTATLLDPGRLLTETEGRLLAAFQAMADDRLARWQTPGQELGKNTDDGVGPMP